MKRLRKAGLYILTMFLVVFVLAEVSGAGSLTVQAAAKKPGKPAIVSVTNTASGIVFKWKKVSGAKGYYVYRRGAGEKFSKIATLKSLNTVSYTDKSVKNKEGVVYVYTVRAYNGKLVSDYVTGKRIVRRMPASIKLNKTSASIKVGASVTLKATVTGSSKKVTWTSSNTKVAAVQNGKVTGKQAGKAVITAKANGKTAKCTVTVKAPSAKEIYKSLLEKGKYAVTSSETISMEAFCLLDVDGNGTPELIVKDMPANLERCNHYVFSVNAGKLVYCGSYYTRYDGEKVYYNSKFKALRNHFGTPGDGAELFCLYKYRLTPYRYIYVYPGWEGTEYYLGVSDVNRNRVSKATYDIAVNLYLTGLKSYGFYSNTASNRKIQLS